MEKRCIFHIPNYLDPNRASASQIRPKKMMNAFEQIGYKVDIVQGYGRNRKRIIEEIKRNIDNGVKYEFLYSESSTAPTLLTEKHHFPTYPFLDFGFFKYIKDHGIKIGLFYRDIYWKFPEYKKSVKGIKYHAAILMYCYDLMKYKDLVDKLYLPSIEGYKYIKREIPFQIIGELPPGCECNREQAEGRGENKDTITLLYVGGLGGHYRIHEILKAVSEIPKIELNICCREDEWEQEKEFYSKYLKENIHICHEKEKGLEKLYERTDIGLVYFEPSSYRRMAMPYKTFEYLEHGLPVIASSETAIGYFIEKKNIGWSIKYDANELKKMLLRIINNYNEILEKREKCKLEISRNTWMQRAKRVEKDLCQTNEKEQVV